MYDENYKEISTIIGESRKTFATIMSPRSINFGHRYHLAIEEVTGLHRRDSNEFVAKYNYFQNVCLQTVTKQQTKAPK
jgi:hypothetical protein